MKKHYIPLRRRIEDAELSLKELAAQADIGESTLSIRLSRVPANWRACEVASICKVVGIPRSQIGDLFFPDVAEEVQ